jgi:anti-sigma regulatory factor (Ser/Thr protein kinase)
VRDDSYEYNPLARESPDLDVDILERGVGGLGIHLIKELADDCSYTRQDGWNIFTARLRLSPGCAANKN